MLADQHATDATSRILYKHAMTRRKNPRVIILAIALLIGAIALVAREHRPSFLRPGLRLNAYVTTLDGNVSVVDLVKLRAIARIPVRCV